MVQSIVVKEAFTMHRRIFVLNSALGIVGLGVTALTTLAPAQAATQIPFTTTALGIAQEAGKPILIAVHADWCPVCGKQKPIIDSLAQTPAFQDLVVLVVDFDNQKDVLKALGVTRQSTLIAMHGTAERDRSVGVTAEDAIRALMLKTKD